MKKTLLALTVPLFCLATVVHAADTDAPKTRAEVKQETRAAVGTMPAKRSETAAVDAVETKTPAGMKSREEVKSETRAAINAGELPKTGQAVGAEAGVDHNAPKKSMKHKKHHRHHATTASAGMNGRNAGGTMSTPSSSTTPGVTDTMGK